MNLCELFMSKGNNIKFDIMKSSEPLIRKRENEYANEVKWNILKPNELLLAGEYGDRFIPRRYTFRNLKQYENINSQKRDKDDIIKLRLEGGYWRQHNLRVNLNSLFDLNPQRILRCNDICVSNQFLPFYHIYPPKLTPKFIYDNKKELDWPCKPRARPLVFGDSTHDLPGFGEYSDLNIIAWSSRGEIAASFDTDLVIWTPETDNTSVYKISNSKCISFSPNGDHIAIGSIKHDIPVIELWDIGFCNILFNTNSYTFSSKRHETRCLEWNKSGKILLCGTKSGRIYLFKVPLLTKIRVLEYHKVSIVSLKLNPVSKYLASSDVEGNVTIYIWPTCTIHGRMGSHRKIRAIIDWHPWNGVDLAISEDFPASIVIVNVQTNNIIAYFQRRDLVCSIDSMSYSKISGELVVSYCIKNPDGCISCETLVLASLDRIVDVMKSHEDRIKCMMWSPDGMQLATAGDDDALSIWNFFALREKSKLKKLTKLSLPKSRSEKQLNVLQTFKSFNCLR